MIRSALMTKAQYLCTCTVQSYDLFWIPLPTYMYIHNGLYAYMYITNMIPLLYLCSILTSGWFPIFTSLVTTWLIRSQIFTTHWWWFCYLILMRIVQLILFSVDSMFCNHRFQFILWLSFNNWSLCLCLQIGRASCRERV